MIPAEVKFTGLTILSTELNRAVVGPIPLHWTRHQFLLADEYFHPENWSFVSWINRNLNGRYNVSVAYVPKGSVVVIGFENDNDAVMFRLLEGETAWRENDSSF